ncbi:MAG: DUF6178 family protein [Kofleriaceae bacterium]
MPTPIADGPLAHLRAHLAGPRGQDRVDALLASDDPAAEVAALTPGAVHELVLAVGIDEAGPLLALATPAQFQGFFDLEVWERDRVDLAQAGPWLAALLDLGFEKVGAVWHGLDPEFRALYVGGQTVVYDLTGGEDPDHDIAYVEDPEPPPVWFSPDQAFAVRLLGGEDQVRLTMGLLDDLYRADMALARHTLLTARSEPTAALEEDSYRWRTGRLADQGYVDFYDALELFAPLSPEGFAAEPVQAAIVVDADGTPMPLALAEKLVAQSFLARAWDRCTSDDPTAHARLEQALVSLVNKVLAAARVRPGDVDAKAAAADYATATVSLGLETVARGDVAVAATMLAGGALTRLHRVGYTVTQKLAKVALALAPRAATADDRATAVVAALCTPRPWLARAVDEPPAPGVRPFASTADLRLVAEILADLALRIAVAERLGVALAAMATLPEPRPALDDHARTALTRWLATGDLAPRALALDQLTAARARLAAGVDAAAAVAVVRASLGDDGGLPARLTALVERWLGELAATLGDLDLTPARFDPRFVEGLLVEVGARA